MQIIQKENKPSFCLGSCDECDATWNFFETPLIFSWHSHWNTFETLWIQPSNFQEIPSSHPLHPLETFLKLAFKALETSLNHPWNALKTPIKFLWNILKTSLEHHVAYLKQTVKNMNTSETPLKFLQNTLDTYLKHPLNTLETWNTLETSLNTHLKFC